MKKTIVVAFCCLLLFGLILPVSTAGTNASAASTGPPSSLVRQEADQTDEANLAFHLPASLERIEDEAFEGVALSFIGSAAITECSGIETKSEHKMLVYVWIPESVISIGDNAFPHSDAVQIVASRGSYAQRWAEERGYCFVEERIASAPISQVLTLLRSTLGVALLFGFLPPDLEKQRKATFRMHEGICRDPKDCPAMRVLELDYP